MALLPKKANTAENSEQLGDFSALPNGEYIAQIKSSEMKKTKAGTGSYLQLIWTILHPAEFKGRVLYDNLNLNNPNPVAEDIANKALNSICAACDKVGVEDSVELHGIPIKLKVQYVKATKVDPENNNIRAYTKFDGELPEADDEPLDAPDKTPSNKKYPWED